MTAAEEKCRQTIASYSLLETSPHSAKPILVGYSGGADSTVLLHLLSRITAEMGSSCIALHIHHGIRGVEADRDRDHCMQFCRQHGIPFQCIYIDVPAIAASTHKSIETCAREERYRAFALHAQKSQCSRIATAHTADDVMETMLFHLTRGCGLHGLCGIPPIRENIIRPLIACTRNDILAYLNHYGLSWVEDSTNTDIAYTRNYIRHEIIPGLTHINLSAASNAATTADLLRCDDTYLEYAAAQADWSPELPDALLSRKIRMGWEKAASSGMLESNHIFHLMDLYRNGTLWKTLSLPGGITARKEPSKLAFYPTASKESSAAYSQPLKHGKNILPNGSILLLTDHLDTTEKDINAYKNIYKLFIHTSVDSDRMKGTVFVRNRLPGDTIRFGRMTRKVRRLMQSFQCSPEQRLSFPIVCDRDGIVWLPGFPPADRVTGNTLHLFYFYNTTI